MIEEMRAELAELSAKLERVKKIDLMLRTLQTTEWELSGRVQSLKIALQKEEADVERLERTTATALLYSFINKKAEKLEKEQQEAVAAKLKYDAAVRQLDDCKARLNELRQEKAEYSGCAAKYDQVFASLREQLRDNPAYAERLCALERRRGEAALQLKELDEAIWAGDAAMHEISAIENLLSSAEGWGTWDLLGGGLISDIAKHSKLDEAQAAAEQLQVLLGRFHTELADVRIDAKTGAVNIDGFLRFADFFFDGLIADWTVLSRIHESQESVQQVKWQVGDILTKLSALKSARRSEQAAVDQQVAELVTNG